MLFLQIVFRHQRPVSFMYLYFVFFCYFTALQSSAKTWFVFFFNYFAFLTYRFITDGLLISVYIMSCFPTHRWIWMIYSIVHWCIVVADAVATLSKGLRLHWVFKNGFVVRRARGGFGASAATAPWDWNANVLPGIWEKWWPKNCLKSVLIFFFFISVWLKRKKKTVYFIVFRQGRQKKSFVETTFCSFCIT